MTTIFHNTGDAQPLLQGLVHFPGEASDGSGGSPRDDEIPDSSRSGRGWLSWLWRNPAAASTPADATTHPAPPSPQPQDPLLGRRTANSPTPLAPLLTPHPLASHTIPIPSPASSSASPFHLSSPPPAPATPSPPPSPSPHSPTRASQASLTPTRSSDSGPQCLICLEALTPEDFESGEAMSLECLCKGDNALRHRSCALKWIEMRGTRICELCKTTIGNLPEPPPRPPSPPPQLVVELQPPLDDVLDSVAAAEHSSAVADQVFDCIRVMWVTMIIGILWFQLPVGVAFLVGTVVGALYCGCCYLLNRYCQPQHADPLFLPSNLV